MQRPGTVCFIVRVCFFIVRKSLARLFFFKRPDTPFLKAFRLTPFLTGLSRQWNWLGAAVSTEIIGIALWRQS